MSERVVCIGDSITEGIGDELGIGWVGRLSHYLCSMQPLNWNVHNLGIAGDTSIDIKSRLMTEVIRRNPSIIFIAGGINDTIHRLWPDTQSCKISFEQSRDEWEQIANILKTISAKIICVGLTPVDEKKFPLIYQPYDDQDKGIVASNSDIIKYDDMLQNWAQKNRFFYIPLFEELNNSEFIKYLPDGLHPNAKGYDMMFSTIKKHCSQNNLFEMPINS
jgi:lysophospholipase L1-like esterase